MDWFTFFWIFWILIFCIIEGLAFASGKAGKTLSEHVWHWFAIPDANAKATGIKPQVTWLIRLRRFALVAFLAWLTLHFLTGGKF